MTAKRHFGDWRKPPQAIVAPFRNGFSPASPLSHLSGRQAQQPAGKIENLVNPDILLEINSAAAPEVNLLDLPKAQWLLAHDSDYF
jgi:hypothetical protein